MPSSAGISSGRHEAGEDEMVLQAGRAGHLLEAPAPVAVAHQQEFDLRAGGDQCGRDGEQGVVAL